MLSAASNRRIDLVQRFAAIGGTAAENVLAPQASAIRILKQPDAHGAARWIVEVRLSIDLEEHLLRDVLGLPFIAEDVDSHAVDQPNVSTEQCPKRVAVRQMHFGDEVGVRLLTTGAALASTDIASHRSGPSLLPCIDVVMRT
jgi:hypothetical protein